MIKLLLILVSSCAIFALFTQNPLEKEIRDADKQLNQFIVQRQAEKAAELYHDDFVLTTSSGTLKTKNEMVAEITDPDLQMDINQTYDIQVIGDGSTAILIAKLHQQGMYKGSPFDYRFLVTDTWVKVNNQWKILAGHATLLTH